MLKVIWRMAAILMLFAASASAQPAPRYADVPLFSLDHEGGVRRFGLYAPASHNVDTPAPLIIALHGRFSSAKAFHAISGLGALADARGALIAYPEPRGTFWNDGGHAALGRAEEPADDVGFIGAMIDAIASGYAVDRARIFVMGYDNGGGLAYRLACERGLPIAGVAVVGGLMWEFARTNCATSEASRATPALIVHGRRDPFLPVVGSDVRVESGGPRLLSASETLAYWLGVNGCQAPSQQSGPSAYYADCANAPVAYVGSPNGGHDWFRVREGQRLNRFGVDATALIDSFFFDRARFALPRPSMSAATPRSYLVYAPPNYDPAQPTPVVVVLHGRPGDAAGMAASSQMNAVAARHGFIVVYPDGLNNEWNSIGDLIGARDEYPQDDIAFLSTLMDDLGRDLNIDMDRLYVTGFSNGGIMTFRMACSAGERFAAFAVVGGAFYYQLQDECRRGRPAPVLIMHGSADRSLPYDGFEWRRSDGVRTQVSMSADDALRFFVRRNGCDETGVRSDFAESGRSPGTQVYRFAPDNCDRGGEVSYYVISGGGHNWPGVEGPYGARGNAVPINHDINAGEEIWAFFSRQRLSDRR